MIFYRVKSWPLRKQLLLLGILPSLLMFFLLSGYFVFERFNDAEKELNARGHLLATQLSHASEFSVISGNMGIIESLIKQLPSNQDIVFVQITDNNANVLLHVNKQDTNHQQSVIDDMLIFEKNIERQPLDVNFLGFDQIDEEVAPVANQTIGRIHLALSTANLKNRQQHILLASLIPALFALFLALLFARGIGDEILKPIKQLSLAARKIKNRNYSVRIESHSQGEIGSLVNDINDMAVALEKSQQEQERLFQQASKAREQAELASQAKSDFLARMSHELRTPMNGVLGMLQLLEITEQSKEQEEYTQTAIDSSNHLLEVINDILDFSRIESGNLQTEIIDFNLQDLIESCAHIFTYTAAKKELNLKVEYLGDWKNCLVQSDPTRIRQVLVNLLSNAIKFTEQGYIQIRACLHQGTRPNLIIEVEDSGIGIGQEKLDTIFDPFLQADTSTSRMFGGTGLGLSIASRLTGLLGGTLSVDSQEGKGSCFTFQIPLNSASYKGLRSTHDSEQPSQGLSISGTVLIVEDNPVNLFVVTGMLKQLGVQVDSATQGQQACQKFQDQDYDCILMDIHMPQMDGFEATRNIRIIENAQGKKRTPIIALTADALFDIKQRCLDSGMDDFLTKPIQRQELEHLLHKWLNR